MDKELLKLPVLSIRQPWAWLIANGYKDIENRSWPTKFRGKFLIHAGKKWDEDTDTKDIFRGFNINVPENLELGGIVGIAEITDCITESNSEWFFGEYGFVIKNARPLPFYPCKGQLGFFFLNGKVG